MRRLIVSPEARRDLRLIRAAGVGMFGRGVADKYDGLLRRAFTDLRLDPRRPAASMIRDTDTGLWSYHIRASRHRAPAGQRIGRPRHVVIFRFDDAQIEIVRLLRENMDVLRHLGLAVGDD